MAIGHKGKTNKGVTNKMRKSIKLTSCCNAYSTFHDETLCCKSCWKEVEVGEGDGTEYKDGTLINQGKTNKGVTMLTEKQMINIADSNDSNKLDKLNKKEHKQFMNFMFGEEFMDSNDKGSLKEYNNQGKKGVTYYE